MPTSLPNKSQIEFEQGLVFRWAPIHYQSVGARTPRADLLAAVDYDGRWNTHHKWGHIYKYPLIPHVYYSLVETETHWYIIYSFYHPRDWHPWLIPFFQHENDMEGCLMIIEKRAGVRYGYIQGLITASHDGFWLYTFDNRLEGGPRRRGGQEVRGVDGTLLCTKLEGVYHPALYQDPYGHGLWAWDGGSFRGEYLEYHNGVTRLLGRLTFVAEANQGVRYYPAKIACEPPYPYRAPIGGMDVPYKLVSIFEGGGLGERRYRKETYAPNGAFQGNYPPLIGKNKANPPWRWKDKDMLGVTPPGMMAYDPARLAYTYFSGFSTDFDFSYLHNPYLKDGRSNSGPNDINQKGSITVRNITVGEEGVLDFDYPEAEKAFQGPFNPPIKLWHTSIH
ncbi:MAG: hypothetical protein V3U90_07060 [Dehalococcoidia bacterium]